MAKRLRPEERRALIVEETLEMIGEKGPDGLSLRSVARWCGMTAPGILHHFAGLQELLIAAMDERAKQEYAAFAGALPDDPTLLDWINSIVEVSVARAEKNLRFDALELQALAEPSHPLHNYFLQGSQRPFPLTVELAAKGYPKNPQAVVDIVRIVIDGLRFRWLKAEETPDYLDDWASVRDTIFDCFEQYR